MPVALSAGLSLLSTSLHTADPRVSPGQELPPQLRNGTDRRDAMSLSRRRVASSLLIRAANPESPHSLLCPPEYDLKFGGTASAAVGPPPGFCSYPRSSPPHLFKTYRSTSRSLPLAPGPILCPMVHSRARSPPFQIDDDDGGGELAGGEREREGERLDRERERRRSSDARVVK